MQESVATSIAPIELRYRPLLELGRGGTARVYLAETLASGLKKRVVLKTLEPELSMDTEMRSLFRREAEVCARLNHPNIVQVNEVVEQLTGPVIVMEYLEGVALSQFIVQSKVKSPKRIYLHAITQLLAGLHYFHELKDYDRTTALKPVHRDVSPQNVIVLYEGAVKVLDFGIAKLANEDHVTQTGVVKGKLHYMPAEQLLADMAIDRRADLFSAGVMLWEALAGRRMWHGQTENAILQALVRGNIPNLRDAAPGLPEYVYDIVAKATAHNPDDRYATAYDLQIDVERILADLGGPVHPREISEFMRTEFGARRQQQDAAIEQASHNPTGIQLTAGRALDGVTGDIRQDSRSARTPLGRSEVRETQQPPKRSRNRIGVVVGLVVLGLGLFVAFGRRTPAPNANANASASSQPALNQAPESVKFSIKTTPTGALVLLDGSPLGRTPWNGTILANRQSAKLELRAENFETFTKMVSLMEDFNLDVQLQAVTPTPPPATSAAPDEDKDKRKVFSRRRGGGRTA
ncbi:MAG TPA: serine/threonine-protein kinase, partial [Polyangiaceae bacterium]